MLAFLDKYKGSDVDSFESKVNQVADDLRIDPNWLMGVMNFESRLDPHITNSIGATGLIQFLPSTAQGLGTSTDALRQMSGTQQMDYVEKYFQNVISQHGPLTKYVDVYLAVFFPAVIGKSSDTIIQSSGISADTIARENPAFNPDKKDYITVGDIENTITSRIPLSLQAAFSSATVFAKSHVLGLSIAGVGLIAIIFSIYYLEKK